jgi:hypothetical protein
MQTGWFKEVRVKDLDSHAVKAPLASPGIAHIEVDVWVILRRLSPNALKLTAANMDDRHPNLIVKLRITCICSARLRCSIDEARCRA